jgi:hypothetical protein
MSTLDEAELQARVAAVRDGPWARRASAARSPFAFRTAAYDLTEPESYIFPKPQLSGPLVSSELPITFPIWRTQSTPLTDTQQQARNTFDDAYTYFQLVDLAIDTGYLPANQIEVPVRLQLSQIIRPPRGTISIGNEEFAPYVERGFETKPFLTQRSEPTHPDCAGHFASFLATDHSLNRNPLCVAWQSLLADKPDEQRSFYVFLNSRKRATLRRQQTLILGAQSSVVQLADFLIPLPESLQMRFAYLYGSRLRRFFGYRRDHLGLSLALEPWTYAADSWAVVLGNWINERGSGAIGTDSSLADPSLYHDSVRVLKPICDRVQQSLAAQEVAFTSPYAPI